MEVLTSPNFCRLRKIILDFQTFHSQISKGAKDFPRLPKVIKDDHLLYLRLVKYLMFIQAYLKKDDSFRIKIFNEFLEIDYQANSSADLGIVIKSGWAQKQIGGRYRGNKLYDYVKGSVVNWFWKKRFFVLTDEGIGYTNFIGLTEFRDVLAFDNSLQIRIGPNYTEEKAGIILYTTSRRLKIRVKTKFQMLDWLAALVDSVQVNPYCKKTRFNSFSPIRERCYAQWYINAHNYYSDLADDIKQAKNEIFITDWWLSPEIYLKRPIPLIDGKPDEKNEWRLDNLLKAKAEAGVKIYVLIYREFEQALANNSMHTYVTLIEKIPNINVLRHPKTLIRLWSHHEKSCTIDQSVTYMGGLDLCFGRYDRSDYPLFEPDDVKDKIYFPGQDYTNVRIKDFSEVNKWDTCLIDKDTEPRMPWRDIAIRLTGSVAKDVARHFIQYWNFAKYDIEGKNQNRKFLHKKNYSLEPRKTTQDKRWTALDPESQSFVRRASFQMQEMVSRDLLNTQFDALDMDNEESFSSEESSEEVTEIDEEAFQNNRIFKMNQARDRKKWERTVFVAPDDLKELDPIDIFKPKQNSPLLPQKNNGLISSLAKNIHQTSLISKNSPFVVGGIIDNAEKLMNDQFSCNCQVFNVILIIDSKIQRKLVVGTKAYRDREKHSKRIH